MKQNFSYYLTPWLRLLAFVALIILVAIPLVSVLQTSPIKETLESSNAINSNILNELLFALIVLTALGIMLRFSRNRPWLSVFFRSDFALSGLVKGTVIGMALVLVITAILYGLGTVDLRYVGFSLRQLGPLFILFLSVAVFEEFLFRSFVLSIFAERYPILLAVLINGFLFAAAHLGNDHYDAIGFANITLAGILLAIVIIQKWNIAWAIGLHLGWNAMQGAVLGFPVSGLDNKGIFVAKVSGPNYLSGGQFGIEGSLICTMVLLVLAVSLFYFFQIHPLATLEQFPDGEDQPLEDDRA